MYKPLFILEMYELVYSALQSLGYHYQYNKYKDILYIRT